MSRKELILRMMKKLPENVTYDRVIYHLDVMRAIEEGEDQLKRGEGIEHEQLFAELLAEDANNQNRMESAGQRRSARHSSIHRSKRSPNSSKVHKEAQRSR